MHKIVDLARRARQRRLAGECPPRITGPPLPRASQPLTYYFKHAALAAATGQVFFDCSVSRATAAPQSFGTAASATRWRGSSLRVRQATTQTKLLAGFLGLGIAQVGALSALRARARCAVPPTAAIWENGLCLVDTEPNRGGEGGGTKGQVRRDHSGVDTSVTPIHICRCGRRIYPRPRSC